MRNGSITKIKELPWQLFGLILDPYSGSRVWWKGSHHNVVFVDKYLPIPSGVMACSTALPFKDGTFDSVCADPPHWIRKSPLRRTSHFVSATATAWNRHALTRDKGYFGTYPTRDALRLEWTAVGKEMHRVTKAGATLIWKSIDGAKTKSQCCNADDLLCLTTFWIMVDCLIFKSCVSWSSANTIWTYWKRDDKVI